MAKIIDRKEKRVRILMAALKVFAEKGISSATIREIAEEANIGKGTIYEYFKSKDDIIFSAFSFFIEESKISISRIKSLTDSPEEKLKKALLFFREIVKEEGMQTFEIMFDFWAMGIKEKKYRSDFYKYLKDFYSGYRNVFANIIREGQVKGVFKEDISPENAGAMIIGMLDGLMVQWILDGKNVNYGIIVKTMGEIIISGLKEE